MYGPAAWEGPVQRYGPVQRVAVISDVHANVAARITALSAGIEERVLVTGHTHLQFDRRIAGLRSVNPGSVGLPHHEGAPGTAYWALLGPDVELRQTSYDVTEAAAVGGRLGDPGAEVIERLLMTPPTPAEIIEECERLVFAD